MKMSKISKALGAMLLTGAMSGSAFAAESASGVAEHFGLTIKTTKEAQAAAAAGNKEGCLTSIKQAKQHYKEITGDAAGKPMQDAMKRLKEGQAQCEAGDTAAAAATLTEVANSMEKIKGSK